MWKKKKNYESFEYYIKGLQPKKKQEKTSFN